MNEIKCISSSHEYWIVPFDGKSLNLGSPKRKSRECLMKMLRTKKIQKIVSTGSMTGDVPGATRLDKWVRFFMPLWVIGFLLHVFEPWIIHWETMDLPRIVVHSIGALYLILLVCGGIVAVFYLVKQQEYWKGSWRIDRTGFWQSQSGQSPMIIPIVPGDGIINMTVRYGGKNMMLQHIKVGDLFTDLLALHLQWANASFHLKPFWPCIVTPLEPLRKELGW
ncbi:hypothetical protein K8T06_07360 [bacterium]|nr:hypothetical protein [bacterium]